jgi:hypothetical protein
MAGAKRKLLEEKGGEKEEEGDRERGTAMTWGRKRRKLEFQDVTVFHFNRRQGFVCVPSQVCAYL